MLAAPSTTDVAVESGMAEGPLWLLTQSADAARIAKAEENPPESERDSSFHKSGISRASHKRDQIRCPSVYAPPSLR